MPRSRNKTAAGNNFDVLNPTFDFEVVESDAAVVAGDHDDVPEPRMKTNDAREEAQFHGRQMFERLRRFGRREDLELPIRAHGGDELGVHRRRRAHGAEVQPETKNVKPYR